MTADLILDGQAHDLPGGADFGEWATSLLSFSGWRRAVLRGEHTTEHGLGLTGLRQNVLVDATELVLTGSGCPVILDLSDSVGVQVNQGRYSGDPSNPPGVGIICARVAEQGYRSAGKNTFWGVECVGDYTIAAHLNIGAEQVMADRMRAESLSSPAVIMAATNRWGAVSVTPGLTPGNQKSEALAEFRSLRASSRQKNGPGAVIVDGFDRVHFSGQSSISSSTHALVIDTTTEAVIGPFVDALYARPLEQGIAGCVVYRGSPSEGIVQHVCRLTAAGASFGASFLVEEPLEFIRCEWHDHEAATPPQWGPAIFKTPCRYHGRDGEVWWQ